jgi:hypothetical protein
MKNIPSKDEMLLIRKFANESEAKLYLNLLQENELEGFITNILSNQLIPAFSNEICLFVHKSDYLHANRIIDEFDEVTRDESYYKVLADNIPSKMPMKGLELQKIVWIVLGVIGFFILFRYLKK